MQNKIDSFSGEYRFLSNFWPVKIDYEGILYPSTEHAYQAQKTLDLNIRQEIAKLETAGKAKKFGEDLKNSNKIRKDWKDGLRLKIMYQLVEQKFSAKNPELMQKLLKTGATELIEGNTWGDTFFGICNGIGENYLGKSLMTVREALQK